MPWLVGTALIHSLAVTEKRGAFKSWTVLLAIAAFSLWLLGTFLVRSGVLTSVHAFATDPEARRLHPRASWRSSSAARWCSTPGARRTSGWAARFELVSRESLLLANNVLLMVAAAIGAARHALSAVPRRARTSARSRSARRTSTRVRAADGAAVFLMGVGPLARWKKASAARAVRRGCAGRSRSSVVAALVAAVRRGQVVAAGRASACCSRCGSSRRRVVNLRERAARRAAARRSRAKLRAQPRSYYGMLLAHSASRSSSSA